LLIAVHFQYTPQYFETTNSHQTHHVCLNGQEYNVSETEENLLKLIVSLSAQSFSGMHY